MFSYEQKEKPNTKTKKIMQNNKSNLPNTSSYAEHSPYSSNASLILNSANIIQQKQEVNKNHLSVIQMFQGNHLLNDLSKSFKGYIDEKIEHIGISDMRTDPGLQPILAAFATAADVFSAFRAALKDGESKASNANDQNAADYGQAMTAYKEACDVALYTGGVIPAFNFLVAIDHAVAAKLGIANLTPHETAMETICTAFVTAVTGIRTFAMGIGKLSI